MTNQEFLAIFGKAPADVRWISSADSAEFLQRVIYFADRNRREEAA